MQTTYTSFGKQLVDKKIITQQQLDEALHRQQTTMSNRKLGEILVRLGYLSKSQIIEALAEQLGLPLIDLAERDIAPRIRALMEGSIATLYRVVPLEERGRVLVVATSDPTNINTLDNLSRLLDRPVEPALATPESITEALGRYYGHQKDTVESMLSSASSASSVSSLSSLSNIGSGASSSFASFASLSADDLSIDSIDLGDAQESMASVEDGHDDSPVVRYVQQLIVEAYRLRASDIHIEPGKTTMTIRYRIDGVMQIMPTPPKRAQPAIISRLKIMAGMDISERRIPQDGRIKMSVGTKDIDLRVSALPGVYGESVVMRILDKSGLLLGLGQLGFCAEHQAQWERLIRHATGVVLVTGPTGSGKTTTLYGSLNTLNTPDTKIITVEDPVEYQLTGINQVQINHEIGWDFARALRAIFRQDPDIVMVGEIRDEETAEIAIKAALTGHLVFSTLHTNDTASSFTRLVDIGIKPFLVASGVRAILAQRLVRTVCNACRTVYEPAEVEKERMEMDIDWSSVRLEHGAGCESCNETGYQGRLGAYELLLTTDAIRSLLMDGESATGLRRQARLDGMMTMREDAWNKALRGLTTIEEVNRRTRVDEPLIREKKQTSETTSDPLPAEETEAEAEVEVEAEAER
jgi:type II secretory ATPase GspE/PulE/Tfp pilus assembly ATPase PilB-like protein